MTVKFLKSISSNIERTGTPAHTAADAGKQAGSNGRAISSNISSQASVSKSDAAITMIRTSRGEAEKVRDFDKAKSLAKSISERVLELDKEEAEEIHNPQSFALRDSFSL